MSLSLEDHEILSEVYKFCITEFPKYYHLKESHEFPLKLFKDLGTLGATGVATSENFGGLAKTSLFVANLMEQMASVDLGPAVFLSVHLMVSKIIENFADEKIKGEFLQKLVSGQQLGAFALTEPSAGSDAASIRSEVKIEADNFILNGQKCYITSAGWADIYIVFARTKTLDEVTSNKDGISAFIIPASLTGVTAGKPERKMGCELSPISTVHFDNVNIPREYLLGELHKGYKIALSGLASGRINIGGCANGISKSAIEKSSLYMTQRKQFGKDISEFQGLQFILADMRIKYESARQMVFYAADCLDKNLNPTDPNLYPSIAKCLATDNAMSITTDAVQLFGGAGYIEDYQVEGLMRDAKMLQIVEGSNQIQRNLIAKSTLKMF